VRPPHARTPSQEFTVCPRKRYFHTLFAGGGVEEVSLSRQVEEDLRAVRPGLPHLEARSLRAGAYGHYLRCDLIFNSAA